MTLNGVIAVVLRYFTDFGKPALHDNRIDLWRNLYESTVFCSACTMSSARKFTFAISSVLFAVVEILVYVPPPYRGTVSYCQM